MLDLSVLGQISETALTEGKQIELQANSLPNTFVPGRNLPFLSLAVALAYRRGADVLVGSMYETDFSGYLDCRDDTIKAQQVTLTLGLGQRMTIETPLMWLDKAATWALAEQLGGPALIELIAEHTHTCYIGERGIRHEWGYGCGQCPACALRRRGHAARRAAGLRTSEMTSSPTPYVVASRRFEAARRLEQSSGPRRSMHGHGFIASAVAVAGAGFGACRRRGRRLADGSRSLRRRARLRPAQRTRR